MSEKAIINNEIIKWARITAKMSLEEVSSKLVCKIEKLEAWENGTDYPTIRQAEKLSQIYRRPLAVFYLPNPPKDFQTLRDFRSLEVLGEYSTALTFIIRDVQERQSWIKQYLKEQGEGNLDFLGRFNEDNQPNEVADNIKKVLEIDENVDTDNILKYWISKIESKGIFVSLASNVHPKLKIDVNEVRGFAIFDRLAPFIFINSDDHKNAQLFTLAHELAHIWINSSGVSNIEFREYNVSQYNPIEVFCNEVAAEILLPKAKVLENFKENSKINLEDIDNFSRNSNVSSYFVSVRLLKLELIGKKLFGQLQSIFNDRYKSYLEKKLQKKLKQKEQAGGPNYYLLQIRKNSKAFTHIIYDSYRGGRISGYEASSLLRIKINNFSKLTEFLHT